MAVKSAMGEVDLHFRPSVPVYDANVALGRRAKRRVRVDSVEGMLKAMREAGVDRALVYSTYAAEIDSFDGNHALLEMIGGHSSLVAQFACNPTFDKLDSFAVEVAESGVRSVRMFPTSHNYPFRDWTVGSWLDWLEAEGIALWIAADDFSPGDLYDTMRDRPGVSVVMCEVHYTHAPWALPLLRSLPNLHVEVSRFVLADGISRLLEASGHQRVLYGSRFPDSPMAPQLYSLHRCGLSETALSAICATNLRRLLARS